MSNHNNFDVVGVLPMNELIMQIVAQSPAIAVLIYLVWRLDSRLAVMQDTIIRLLEQALENDDDESIDDKR
jgi:hypothetical protein